MTIKDDYFRYLDHFGSTLTLRELHQQPGRADAIALRHDIDHDLDLALEVAHHEHARGIHATYFLLHTHAYWNDPQFHAKCAQLQAYGHEVGLHLNVLVQWMNRECEDVDQALADALAHLRQRDVIVEGVSAHGDKGCYQHQVINYWMFQELRGPDPLASETHRSAEGVIVDDPRWQVTYPTDDTIHRDDGRSLPLWSTSMARHGLRYDAMHVPMNHYWTDSGGTWSRSGDPLHVDLSRGRHQVLMHPIWWRGPRKTILVMSTARAGSTWLANFVDRATSCRGVHEWTLNHYRRGDEIIADKRTSDDYLALLENASEAALLIRHAMASFKVGKRDVLEANVYLEPFLERLQKASPPSECVFMHLHRDAREVVRSILNRGWYAAPIDYRRRDDTWPAWPVLNQFERACWYWRWTNERLWPLQHRLSFERMVSDQEYLTSSLNDLGIVVHPLLAHEEFAKRLNAGTVDEFPCYGDWPEAWQVAFEAICGPMQQLLGYDSDESKASRYRPPSESRKPFGASVVNVLDVLRDCPRPLGVHNVRVSEAEDGMLIQTIGSATGNGHVVLANGTWRETQRSCGIRIKPRTFFTGSIQADLIGGVIPRVFLLCFNRQGRQMHKMQLTTLRPPVQRVIAIGETSPDHQSDPEAVLVVDARMPASARFSFVPPDDSSHFALAIVVDGIDSAGSKGLIVRNFSLATRRVEARYRAKPDKWAHRARVT